LRWRECPRIDSFPERSRLARHVPTRAVPHGGVAGVLLAFGLDADVAIVSVLSYRAVAIWLPAPIGLAALSSLRGTLERWAAEASSHRVHAKRT
jgi:hypothetical protein